MKFFLDVVVFFRSLTQMILVYNALRVLTMQKYTFKCINTCGQVFYQYLLKSYLIDLHYECEFASCFEWNNLFWQRTQRTNGGRW